MSVNGTGDAQYSAGLISVNLVSGKRYLFVTAWDGSVSLYDNGANHPVSVGFGDSITGFNSDTSIPDSIVSPAGFNLVYNQQIKYVE